MRWDLNVIGGPDMGKSFFVEEGETRTIGRSSSADFVIDDPKISRIHCSVAVKEGFATLNDNGSRNGTFLNKKRVGTVPLKKGDQIFVGKSVIAVDSVDVQESSIYRRHMIGPFRLVSRIGIGGMAIVYLAERMSPSPAFEQDSGASPGGERVALKVLKGTIASQHDLLKRFYREARTGMILDHPNVAKTVEIGKDGNTQYIVMEYCPGVAVSDLLEEKKKLPIARSLNIAAQVVEAMRHAWRQGIVHRDIKPENIILMDNDLAKVTDFGLAKFMDGSTGNYLTHTGEGLGTICYLPPEQIDKARTADIRADIYSFGATLYHMIGGSTPLDRSNIAEFFKAIRNEVPKPLREIDGTVPAAVSDLVDKCLEKNPDNRFASPDDLAKALRKASKGVV